MHPYFSMRRIIRIKAGPKKEKEGLRSFRLVRNSLFPFDRDEVRKTRNPENIIDFR